MADYSNSKFNITVVADRIFKLKPVPGAEITVGDVKNMREIHLRLSGGQPFAILLDATGEFEIGEEARKLIASGEYSEKRISAAFVTPGLVNRLVGNFFIQFNKPASPTRLFSDEASALAWLKEQMKNHSDMKKPS
jgi:hypothetical protein